MRPFFCGLPARPYWEFGMHVVECDVPSASALGRDLIMPTFPIPTARRRRVRTLPSSICSLPCSGIRRSG